MRATKLVEFAGVRRGDESRTKSDAVPVVNCVKYAARSCLSSFAARNCVRGRFGEHRRFGFSADLARYQLHWFHNRRIIILWLVDVR